MERNHSQAGMMDKAKNGEDLVLEDLHEESKVEETVDIAIKKRRKKHNVNRKGVAKKGHGLPDQPRFQPRIAEASFVERTMNNDDTNNDFEVLDEFHNTTMQRTNQVIDLEFEKACKNRAEKMANYRNQHRKYYAGTHSTNNVGITHSAMNESLHEEPQNQQTEIKKDPKSKEKFGDFDELDEI